MERAHCASRCILDSPSRRFSMTTHLHRILAGGLCLLGLFLNGCVAPNHRYAEMGPVSARAHLRKGLPSYYNIEIQRPTDASAPLFSLRLPDGQILRRTSLTYDALKRTGFSDYKPDYQTQYSHELIGHGVSFRFSSDTLMVVQLGDVSRIGGGGVGIGRDEGKHFHVLPLTQEEFESVFGRPNKTSDGHFW
jgi:hypothetical protein